jgi:hypothetical protein
MALAINMARLRALRLSLEPRYPSMRPKGYFLSTAPASALAAKALAQSTPLTANARDHG